MSPQIKAALQHLAQVCNDLAATLPKSAVDAFAAQSNEAIKIIEDEVCPPQQPTVEDSFDQDPLTAKKTPSSSQT